MIDLASLLAVLSLEEPRIDQAVGFYSKGALSAASGLPSEAPGMLKLFRPRDRGWGADEMTSLLLDAADRMAAAHPGLDRLQVGDLSAHEGGRITGHASHQNGLDADLAYFRRDGREQDPQSTSGFDEEFVSGGGLTANFDLERNWELLRALTASGRVARIFVDPVIKREMCELVESEGGLETHAETLRRLRPYSNHGDHLHVRIRCPDQSPRCRQQEEPPAGHGCAAISLIEPGEFEGVPAPDQRL